MSAVATKKYFIIDFDSTFTRVEALEVLGAISLKDAPDRQEVVQAITNITNQAMAGSLSFRESLEQRVALLRAHKNHLPPLVDQLRHNVSTSFVRNKDFFETYAQDIFIVSNGFKDFIVPIVKAFGIPEENVYANTFTFDASGNITGFDANNVLSANNGKVEQLKALNLEGDVYVIGDGYTDYEIKAAGLANRFYAFTENVARENVTQKADHIAPSLDEFLYVNKLNKAISYPKNRIKVLLLENIHAQAEAMLRQEGYQVEVYPAGLDEEELCQKIKNVSILGIRSKTNVTARVLEHANRLIAVGAFCIGTNQIDLEACLKKGVAVFNAPFSNTRSVVELAVAEIIMLMRNLPDKFTAMHQGSWEKSAAHSYEIRGKKLGIVGYGNIGAQLSVVAEAMGMDVYYYDLAEKLALGNATKCLSLEELLRKVDVVSLHVDGRPENKELIGAYELGLMKKGSYLLNLARGKVVNIEALVQKVQEGHIKGVGVDVFPQEPKSNQDPFESALRQLPNTLLSPHVGGSTLEAQENIADFVPGKIMEYINTGSTTNSVNLPELQLPTLHNAHRLIHLHHNVPGILAKINQILANNGINVVGQYLKTNETVGYVITDIDKAYNKELIATLRNIEHTIRLRVLY